MRPFCIQNIFFQLIILNFRIFLLEIYGTYIDWYVFRKIHILVVVVADAVRYYFSFMINQKFPHASIKAHFEMQFIIVAKMFQKKMRKCAIMQLRFIPKNKHAYTYTSMYVSTLFEYFDFKFGYKVISRHANK